MPDDHNELYALADAYAEVRLKRDALDRQDKALIREQEELESKLIQLNEKLELSGPLYIPDKGRLSFVESEAVKVLDQTTLHEWLRERKSPLLKETVNANSLRAFCKECNAEGEAIPPGVRMSFFTRCAFSAKAS